MDQQFNVLDYWLGDEQQPQLKIILRMLRILNNQQCKIVFSILNTNDKITCPKICIMGGEQLDEPRVYQYLKKLENMNFVTTERINGKMHYSLVKAEIADFADCINLIGISAATVADEDTLDLKLMEQGVQKKYILDYRLTNYLQACIKCLVLKAQRGLLKSIYEKLYEQAETEKKFHNSTCTDSELTETGQTLTTVTRNLEVLAKRKLTIRKKEKNLQHNTLNVEQILKVCRFLIDTSHRNFDKKNSDRRIIFSKPIRLPPGFRPKV